MLSPLHQAVFDLRRALEQAGLTTSKLSKVKGLTRHERKIMRECDALVWQARDKMLPVLGEVAERSKQFNLQ